MYFHASQTVHVLFVQSYLYHALHVNPHVFADVHALVHPSLFAIAVHAVQLSAVFHAAVYVPFPQAVHVLFVQSYLYHALHVNPHVSADVHALVHPSLCSIAVHVVQLSAVFHASVYFHASQAVQLADADELIVILFRCVGSHTGV